MLLTDLSSTIPHRSFAVAYLTLIAWAFILAPPSVVAQRPDEVKQAFIDLREDNIRYNCSRATYWLYKRRDELRGDMLTELYRTTDPQERDSLLLVLFETRSFTPDERFARFVVQRLREEDTRVPNSRFVLPSADDDGNVPLDLFGSAHRTAWFYINEHYQLFEPILKPEIGETNDMWELFGITWMMKLKGELKANIQLFTPAAFQVAADNLKDDDKDYNASEAARFFLLLGEPGLAALKKVSNSADSQQKRLADALTQAITTGSRDAYGYINSQCDLIRGVMGVRSPEPAWLGEVTMKYAGYGAPHLSVNDVKEAESKLNATYADVLKKLPPPQRQKVISVERTWVAFKESNEALLNEFRKAGLITEATHVELLYWEPSARTSQLQQLMAPMRPPMPRTDRATAQTEKELNQGYQTCLQKLSPQLRQELQKSQRLWITFRQANQQLLPSEDSSVTYSRIGELERFENAARFPESTIPNPFAWAK